MKKIYFSIIKGFLGILLFFGIPFNCEAQTVISYSYTGNVQTFTVPPCITTISVDVSGSQGATAPTYSSPGGLGGRITGVYPVTSGQVFYIYVGGQNYNGGGTGSTYGGVGGGASDIRTGGTALSNRVFVGGGGGGGGTNCFLTNDGGGAGGGIFGTSGYECGSQTLYIGTGGNQTVGGISLGGLGTNGAFGLGGNGSSTYGGGGGGGYYGGGGASYGGGGGGSSYASASASFVVYSQGEHYGNGIVTISYNQNINGVTILPSSTLICSGTSATLNANSAISYTWNTTSNSTSIVVSPTTSAVYSVQGTNSVGCITSASIGITVNPSVPSLTVTNTGSTGICPGSSATLTAYGANSYVWTGNITNGVSFSPLTSSGYTVTGINTCGTTTAVASISINPTPSITIANSSPTICSGNTATLTATGGNNYVWTGPSTVTNGLAFLPNTSGNYTVYAYGANGCSNTAITSIMVVITPGNSPTAAPPLLCVGGTANISATGATNYTWLPGNLSTSVIAVNPTVTTTYTVIKSNANCFDTKTLVLNVVNLPSLILLASNTIVCANNTLQLAGGGAISYTWSPPGVTGASIIATPSIGTIYTLTGSNGTCVNTSTVSIITKPNPTINIVPATSVMCVGFCNTITASGATSYTWSANPAGISSLSGSASVICPTITTNYSISGTNSLGCVTSATQIVLVNPNPTFTTAANPPVVCVAGISTISSQPLLGVTYSWSTGASTRTTQVSALTTSNYSVTTTFTQTGCYTTKTVSVAVFIPTIIITGPTAVCPGGTVTVNATGASNYTWVGGGYTSTGFASFPVSPTVPTIYVCTGSANAGTVVCAQTKTFGIGVYSNPTITAAVTRTLICIGENVNLIGGGAATYLWSDNQIGSTVSIAPTANAITYSVTGTDANGCVGTATVLVRTQSCVGIDEYTLNIKTFEVFPNPSKGEFIVQGNQEMNLKIIDEMGRIVKLITLKELNGLRTNVNGLSSGIYFIVGEKNNVQVNQKIIINN